MTPSSNALDPPHLVAVDLLDIHFASQLSAGKSELVPSELRCKSSSRGAWAGVLQSRSRGDYAGGTTCRGAALAELLPAEKRALELLERARRGGSWKKSAPPPRGAHESSPGFMTK